MKNIVLIILLCFAVSNILVGCGKEASKPEQISQSVSIGNPWSDWETIEAAEVAVGFTFGLPEVIADNFTAAVFRTLNNKMIEVIYRHEDFEICVRKQMGEGQDISGDYNQYDICTEESIDGGTIIDYYNSDNSAVKQIISYNGYSWSLIAPNGYGDDSNWNLMSEITE